MEIARRGGNAVKLLGAEVQTAARGDRLRMFQQVVKQPIQRRILRPANIQRELNLAGDHVHRPRQAAQLANRRHQVAALLSGSVFNNNHPLGGGGQRVPAVVHRHGSRVTGLAGEAAVQTARAVNGFHHAKGEHLLLKARPLLNMQLQIGAEILLTARGMPHAGRIEPHQGHRLRHADSAGVGFFQPALRPGARQPPAA